MVEVLEESGNWRAREVTYWAGTWDQMAKLLPRFETADFRVGSEEPANPYMRTVVRLPRNRLEQKMPVGTVSNTYTLAQHTDVGEKCIEGIRQAGVELDGLRCELGLTELGEWMNLRLYFPKDYNHKPPDGNELGLRVECFNSVDGSSRLVILLGWLRFVCSNGLVIGETKTELRDIHNQNLDVERIPQIIRSGLVKVQGDLKRLRGWENAAIEPGRLVAWANKSVSEKWGKRAACRVFHICESGHDVEITDPFAAGEATEKPVKQLVPVPGSPMAAKTLFDVSQALSWVATGRNSTDERVEWQSQITELVGCLAKA